MSIKVITDSTSDIPSDLVKKLDIRVVPIYVRFGDLLLSSLRLSSAIA